MKKIVIGLSMLCMCAILSIPVTASFANPTVKEGAQLTNVNEEKGIITEEKTEVAEKEATVVPEEKVLAATKEEATAPEEEVALEEVAAMDESGITKEQALAIIKTVETESAVTYMGDENTYEVIKEEGMAGYVFLPERDGDLGYFVDKATGSVYLFHPSGYFELL